MATLSASKHNPVISAFYASLLKRGKEKMVALTACMRMLLVIINATVRKGEAWQAGLSKQITLAEKLPSHRMLLIWANLQGHNTPEMVLWLFEHGVMPLYTPLGES